MKQITSNEFYNVINQDEKKVVIKFSVNWCPDCKRAEKFDPELEKEFKNNFVFYSINSDENEEIKNQAGVRGFPSYLIFRSGEKLAHLHSKWAKSKEQVSDFLEKNISGNFSHN
jgi:thioredoxin-like negative regulator of GroEL